MHGLLEEFARGAPQLLDELVASAVKTAYEHAGQNQVKAATLLGVSRNTLRTHLKRLAVIV